MRRCRVYMYGQRKWELLGKRNPNPYWFNIEIFAVIASNTLKIRQVFSAVFSLYRQKSLMLNCSHLTLRCFSQDFSAAGCRQADACQIRQAERLQKHPSSGNACLSLACLRRGWVFFYSSWASSAPLHCLFERAIIKNTYTSLLTR